MAPPEGWRSVRLSDLLPSDVIDKLIPLMNQIQEKRLDISAGQKKILALLAPHREELERKGVLDAYLSYWLVNYAVNGPGRDLSNLMMN